MILTENEVQKTKQTRPGKKIKINPRLLNNKKISAEIGTVDNKNCPKTVYLNISFWVDIKDRAGKELEEDFDRNISKTFTRHLRNIYRNDLYRDLSQHRLFPFYYENIYSFDFPENLNYNDKKSFVSIELHLHTVNNRVCSKNPKDFLALRNDSKNEFFSELVRVANIIGDSDLLMGNDNFLVYKNK